MNFAILLIGCQFFLRAIAEQQGATKSTLFFTAEDEDISASRELVASYKAPSELACSQKCLRHDGCNFKIFHPKEQKCELLKSIKKSDLDEKEKPEKRESAREKENSLCKATTGKCCGENCKCVQEFIQPYGAQYICDCTELGVSNTCDAALSGNKGQTGLYRIRSTVLQENIKVECTKGQDGKSFAVFHHDSESKTLVVGYERPGSYKKNIQYEDAMTTIEAFINQSSSCKQHTRVQCHHVTLKDYGWLTGQGGQTLDFWGGGPSNGIGCACGITNSCAEGGAKCNCDKNDGVWRTDEGYVTKKGILPITGIAIGDTGNPSYSERLLYTSGPLFCALL